MKSIKCFGKILPSIGLVVILSQDLINRNLLLLVIFNNLHNCLIIDMVEVEVKVVAMVVEGMYDVSFATRMVM